MKWLIGCMVAAAVAVPAHAQNDQQQPVIVQQAPLDPHEFCYFGGQPYSMGSPYPGTAHGDGSRPMRCQPSEQTVNGYTILEWSDRR
ncbi:MAG: hypothetical protein HIU92_06440 [Proteobacteria bacterium]|nr:hypothetical protein [Pseudomonadota bacterium]